MENRDDYLRQRGISPHVERVLSEKHFFSRELLSVLNATDLQELKEIAMGKIPQISRGDRVKALSAIARIGAAEECKILSKIIADEKEEVDLRAVAAANLSLLPPEDAERELITHLNVENELVQAKIIRSLGCIGSKKAIEALDRIFQAPSDFIKKEIAFAKTLISYRFGLDRDTLPFVPGADRKLEARSDAINFIIKQIGKDGLMNYLQSFEGSNYGIEVSENIGFKVECGGRVTFLFLLNKKYDHHILSSIIEKKVLFGLLARYIEERDTYTTQSLVLSSPYDRHTLDIIVCRTDGEPLFSGRGYIKESTMTFSITDIERPGTLPCQITGRLTDESLEFQKCYFLKRRQNKRSIMRLNR